MLAQLILQVGVTVAQQLQCATTEYQTDDVIYTSNCIAYGNFDWSAENVATLGTVENIYLIMTICGTVWMNYKFLKICKKSAYWQFREDIDEKSQVKNLNELFVKAIRISIFERSNNPDSFLRGAFAGEIFTADPENPGQVIVSNSYLEGLVNGIWTKYDTDENGSLDRDEMLIFFKDIFHGCGMMH